MKADRFVLVEWLDSANPHSRWEWAEAVEPDFVRCVSVGWIVQEDKDSLTLAPTIADNAGERQVNGAHTIPRCAIKRIRRLRG